MIILVVTFSLLLFKTSIAPSVDPTVKIDLVDSYTTGNIVTEKNDEYAIFLLNTGDNCLVSTNRVWLNDKPKFGNWRACHLHFFKPVSVSARKVEGHPEFKYQVIIK